MKVYGSLTRKDLRSFRGRLSYTFRLSSQDAVTGDVQAVISDSYSIELAQQDTDRNDLPDCDSHFDEELIAISDRLLHASTETMTRRIIVENGNFIPSSSTLPSRIPYDLIISKRIREEKFKPRRSKTVHRLLWEL